MRVKEVGLRKGAVGFNKEKNRNRKRRILGEI